VPQTLAVRRIAVVGAECVGKTTLCMQLAQQLPGHWLPEYLREFCDRLGRTPQPGEQDHILRTQIEREASAQRQAAEQGVAWLLCDSAPIVTALYSRMLFDDSTLVEAALAHHRGYWATLLLQPDLPWTADGIQRDGPDVRAQFHRLLAQLLRTADIQAHSIEGGGEARILRARGLLESSGRNPTTRASGSGGNPNGT
jgi:nicotinamide riboside kinase